ncbi:hypothetical protein ACOBM3_17100 [Enterobacter hormaechei]|uniref:hypothetical protein n=1 Tax=Enterobacter hormaechei TaxID=158836 RepID=UPI00197F536D|nr:hypothetical protein [Enterobacter hormaechei]MBN4794984.1 hypothetical protein [Enterobacter hormaechei]MBN4819072.1 hypothetical protein [Enterobacter hormaechei]
MAAFRWACQDACSDATITTFGGDNFRGTPLKTGVMVVFDFILLSMELRILMQFSQHDDKKTHSIQKKLTGKE